MPAAMSRRAQRALRQSALAGLVMLLAGCSAPPGAGTEAQASAPVVLQSGQPEMTPAKPRMTDSGEGSPEVLDLSPWTPPQFWLQVSPGGDAIYSFSSLEDMTAGADLVVVGRALGVTGGRPMSAEAQADWYGLGVIEFAVEESVAGRLVERGPGIINVQFVMGDRRLLPKYAGGVPSERVVLFLMNLGMHGERLGIDPDHPTLGYSYYSIQVPQGVLREVEGLVDLPAAAEDAWQLEVRGRPFPDLVEELVRLAGDR